MKKKILTLFLAMLVALPTISFTFAVTSTELLERLDKIGKDVTYMKKEYKDILDTYPDVIDSLSTKNKEAAKTLADNLMADDIKSNLDSIKQELKASSVKDADKVLDAVLKIENDAKNLINDNKDIVEEVKSGYDDLTVDEIKQVIEKVKDISISLGINSDTTTTYNNLMDILDSAHSKALNINTKVKSVINNNVKTFEEGLTIELLKELATEVKNKDQEAVIDTLKKSLNGLSNVNQVKRDLDSIKEDVKNLKDEFNKLNNLDEQKLLMFTDSQKQDVANKFKQVEQDYVAFAKEVLDNNAKDYIKVAMNLAYDESVDNMIKYANEAIDYVLEHKDAIKSITKQDVLNKVQDRINLPTDTIKKAGMLVALGFIDVTPYNKDYIENNFKDQIDNLSKFVGTEFVDYLDYIDTMMQKEVKENISKYNETVAQKNIITINKSRFKTLEDIKALKTRIEKEFLDGKDDLKQDLSKVASYVYDMYDTNILNTIESIMSLENEKSNKKYEFNQLRYYIIADNFMNKGTVASMLGIPEEYMNIVSYGSLNGSNIKTGSKMTITMSNTVYQAYTYIVLGDIFADGKVDSRDYMAIKNQIMNKKNLDAVCKVAADTYRDSKIDSRDYMAIKNQIMQRKNISL